MKKNVFKKIIAVVMAGTVIASQIIPVSAQEFTQPKVIDMFDSFHGFVKYTDSTLPDGMMTRLAPAGIKAAEVDGNNVLMLNSEAQPMYRFNETISTGILYVSYNLKFENTDGAFWGHFYGNRYNNNVADVRDDELNTKVNPLIGFNHKGDGKVKLADDGNTDTWNFQDGIDMTEIAPVGKWNKYEYIFDFEEQIIHVYINGAKLGDVLFKGEDSEGNLNGVTGVKSVVFSNEQLNGNFSTVYMDNVCISHYFPKTEEKFDDIMMTADYANSGASAEGGVVHLAFSEAISGEFFEEDFVAVNTKTNEKYYPSDVETDFALGAKLTFDTLPVGEYKIGFSDGYKSADEKVMALQAGSKVPLAEDVTAVFAVEIPGEKNGMSTTTRRYYVNDDFNDYVGGIPEGWENIHYDNASNSITEDNLYAVHDSRDGGKAICFNGENGERHIFYDFENAITSGKFTVEFDINHENGRWLMGLMRTEQVDFDTSVVSKAFWETTDVTAAPMKAVYNNHMEKAKTEAEEAGETFDEETWKSENWLDIWHAQLKTWKATDTTAKIPYYEKYADRMKSVLLGSTAQSYRSEDIGYNKTKSNSVATHNDNITNTKETWHTVKMDVDLDAGKISLYLDGQPYMIGANKDTNVIEYNTDYYGANKYYDIDTGYARWYLGLKGIRLGCVKKTNTHGGYVMYDNVKVYTEHNVNDYQTFDTYTGRADEGWYLPGDIMKGYGAKNTTGQNDKVRMTAVEGRNYATNTNDKAAKFTIPFEWNWNVKVTHPLAIPVAAGKSFDVEFDVKTGETGNMFTLSLLGESDMWARHDNMSADDKLNSEVLNAYGTQTDTTKLYINNAVLGNNITEMKAGSSDGTFKFADGTTWVPSHVATNSDGSNIAFKPNEWQHVKLSVNNNDGAASLKLSVLYEDGTTAQSTEFQANSKLIERATTGIMLNAFTSASAGEDRYFIIDNLLVSEQDEKSEAYITGVEAVNADGTTASVSDNAQVASNKLGIKVRLSAPVQKLDNFTIVNADTDAAFDADLSLENNGTVVYAEFNSVPQENQNIKITYGTSDISEFNFVYTPAEGTIDVTDFRMYEYIPAKYNDQGVLIVQEAWAPVQASDLSGYAVGSRFKLVAKGVNTGTTDKLFLSAGKYTASALTNVVGEYKDIPKGTFEIEKEFVFDSGINLIKGFVWDKDYKPMSTATDYSTVQQ